MFSGFNSLIGAAESTYTGRGGDEKACERIFTLLAQETLS
jgi:hypothetical protein